MMRNKDKKFYRYEIWEALLLNGAFQTFELKLIIFKIDKETPKGYWITKEYPSIKHWIEKRKANKKFARETKERALECFIYRTKRRIKYLKNNLNKAEQGLNQALELQKINSKI